MRVSLDIPTPAWAEPLLAPARYKGASGGRSAGRSHFFAERAVEDMVCDPSLRFVCIREVQRSLKFSAKSLVERKIRGLGVSDMFRVLSTEIRRVGGDGVMIFEGMQAHTADSIKSLEGFGRAWVEEAHSLSKRSLDLLLPTIREPSSEIWFSWNPDQPDDPVDAFFSASPEGAVHISSTYLDNPFCPEVMVQEAERLLRSDPAAYEHIWLGGYFFGGTGRVYSNFRNKLAPDGNLDDVEDVGGDLVVGMDFNVNPMSAVLAVRVADECHVLGALQIRTSNTEEMAAEIRRRYPSRHVIVCPDPSGRARKTSAPVGQTDFTILERHGFEVRAPLSAPSVVDRINNTQQMLLGPDGRRRVKMPSVAARHLVTALSHLTYKEGTNAPDKASGLDHVSDALGYLLWQEFPVLDQGGTFTVSTFYA